MSQKMVNPVTLLLLWALTMVLFRLKLDVGVFGQWHNFILKDSCGENFNFYGNLKWIHEILRIGFFISFLGLFLSYLATKNSKIYLRIALIGSWIVTLLIYYPLVD